MLLDLGWWFICEKCNKGLQLVDIGYESILFPFFKNLLPELSQEAVECSWQPSFQGQPEDDVMDLRWNDDLSIFR